MLNLPLTPEQAEWLLDVAKEEYYYLLDDCGDDDLVRSAGAVVDALFLLVDGKGEPTE